jgi:predicted RNase H-like nuclease (RuvC/YqgF family)
MIQKEQEIGDLKVKIEELNKIIAFKNERIEWLEQDLNELRGTHVNNIRMYYIGHF